MTSDLIAVTESGKWRAALAGCKRYDIYHTPEYHALAETHEGGQAHLFVTRRGENVCALPFLTREIDGLPWTKASAGVDANSVYGYAGPVCSVEEEDEELASLFQRELLGALESLGLVSFFCRLHPLIETRWLLKGMGATSRLGSTASIPLRADADADEFLGMMSTNHRRDVRKLRNSGVTVEEDTDFSALGDFIVAYRETMRRNQAADRYYFDQAYFESLIRTLGKRVRLFVAKASSGELLSMLIAFCCGDIIQYHLGATPDRFRQLSAVKLIFAELAVWGAQRNYRHLHLGGGVGATDSDPLFKFKRGFSGTTHPFEVFGLVVQREAYAALCEQRRTFPGFGPDDPATTWFPEYRAPADRA